MIGDLIDEEDEYWECYLAHSHIVDEVFAPVTNIRRTEYLRVLIEEYLHDFKSLYLNRTLTQKMHYLIHIRTWTQWLALRQLPPLISLIS